MKPGPGWVLGCLHVQGDVPLCVIEGNESHNTMNLQSRLATHFAAAAALAALTATATAQVATQVINQVVPANIDGLYVNVETGGTGSTGGTTPGWDINPYSASAMQFFSSTGGGYMRFPGVTTGAGGSLAVGNVIDATGSWNTAVTAVTFGVNPGNWTLNADNYFGFRFIAADAQVHYGWGRMTMGASATVRTLREVHWQMTANAPITVDAGVTQAYGTGCAGLSLGANAAPHFGSSVTYTLSGIPGTAVLSLLFLNISGVDPGTPLGGFGLVGCFSYLDLTTAATNLLLGSPSATFVFNVPNNVAFLGLPIDAQGATLDSSLPGSAALSNGIASVLGR